MPKNKLNSEQQFIGNLLIGFFSALFIVFVLAMIAFFQTLTTYPSAPDLPTVTIQVEDSYPLMPSKLCAD